MEGNYSRSDTPSDDLSGWCKPSAVFSRLLPQIAAVYLEAPTIRVTTGTIWSCPARSEQSDSFYHSKSSVSRTN